MTCTLHVAWDDRLAGYDFGPGHPLAPLRLKLTMELAQAFGLGRLDGVTIAVPAAATGAELELVHDPAYIGMVRLAGHQAAGGGLSGDLTSRALLMHGLGTEDDPLFPGMHEAADGDRGHAGRGPGGLDLGGAARGQPGRRPAPRHGPERQRVLRLQ
jgi:acetoin utilization protein AcuC